MKVKKRTSKLSGKKVKNAPSFNRKAHLGSC